jgi:hypothetical protein
MDDQVAADIRAEVERHGFHVVLVPPGDEGEPAFGFTVGLATTYGHPELCTIGLDDGEANGVMHELLDAAAGIVAEGGRYEDRQVDDQLLVDYPVTFRAVARRHFPTWLAFLTGFHGGDEVFSCLQIVWPDPDRRFPWDEGFDADLRQRQPVLDE